MANMEWSDEYSIHIEEIDKQHHKLFDMLNELGNCSGEESCEKKMGDTIKGLVEYTQYHFAEEEKVMKDYNYPEIDKHKASHKNLVNQIKAILIRLKKGKEYKLDELQLFLEGWLVDHIKMEDVPIGKYVAMSIENTHEAGSVK